MIMRNIIAAFEEKCTEMANLYQYMLGKASTGF
jgi:hypothetical protein